MISRRPVDRVRRYRRLIERLSREADSDGNWWGLFRNYEKNPEATSVAFTVSSAAAQDVALVMQGPVVTRDDLTLGTIRLYRQTMPDVPLIVSTWNGLDETLRSTIESMGAQVVLSDPPADPGPHSLNLQITSTHQGLAAAKSRGCHYAIKTRCDNRIHIGAPDRFLMALLQQFGSTNAKNQNQRLVVLDFATRLYVPYHPSDMLMFGDIDDLITYWDPQLCPPGTRFHVRDQYAEMMREPTPEVVLCRRYLESIGVPVAESIADWWSILADRFIVIDRDMIDWFWPKYDYHVTQRLEQKHDGGNMAMCHFAQWMQIYNGGVQPIRELPELVTQTVHQRLIPVAKTH